MGLVRAIAVLFPLMAVAGTISDRAALEPISYHDNTIAAGVDRDGVREVTFEIRRGLWLPNGPDHPGTPMLAFAEPGQPLRLPGPMVRVVAGTRIAVTVRNATDSTIVLRGLSPDPADSLVLHAGATATIQSAADFPGTRFYSGTFAGEVMTDRRSEDGMLAGAIIVDPPGSQRHDEVLVLTGAHYSRDSLGHLNNDREIYVVNGRPWPFTRRLAGKVGDSSFFRVINASRDFHPMHLHGTAFTVIAHGNLWRDTVLDRKAQHSAVTELLTPGSTMEMAWLPDRPGTWLFHCHLSFHVPPNIGFGADSLSADDADDQIYRGHPMHPDEHVEKGMGGLLMTITVPAPAGWAPAKVVGKIVRLEIPHDSIPDDETPVFAPAIIDGAVTRRAATRNGPGGMLLLHQGEPTTVRVVNNSAEPTSIHWHGMELDNYFDGAVGVGGMPGRRTMSIAPGATFDARMTPPRAGTFIYHTHLMEFRQLEGGLYGAMIVLPRGTAWDAARDHVFIFGTHHGHGTVLNGAKVAPSLEFAAGTTHRLRLINITTGAPIVHFQLVRADSSIAAWTPAAKDAIDLPAARRVSAPAVQMISMGETYDMNFTPPGLGEYRLEVRSFAGVLLAKQPIKVVAGKHAK